MTEEERLKELKMELDKVESQNFYNKMVDRWNAENYRIDRETHERIVELENEIAQYEKTELKE